MDNKSLSHTRWKCQYHIVFIPKYWKKVLYEKYIDALRQKSYFSAFANSFTILSKSESIGCVLLKMSYS